MAVTEKAKAVETATAEPTQQQIEDFSRLLRKDVQFGAGGVQLQNLDEAMTLAKMLAQAGLAGADNPAQVMVKIQTGMELGMPPMMAFKHVHLMPGPGGAKNVSLSVEFCAAVVEHHKALAPGTKIGVRFEGTPMTDNWRCIAYSTPRGGQPIESEPVSWYDLRHLHSVKNKYGKLRENWQNYPKRMMKARAVGYHIKDYYAAQIGGVSIAEDVRDYAASPARGHSPLEHKPPAVDPLVGWMSSKVPEPEKPEPPEAVDNDKWAADYEAAQEETP